MSHKQVETAFVGLKYFLCPHTAEWSIASIFMIIELAMCLNGFLQATNIKYAAVYLQCFYINAIKMHKGHFSFSRSLFLFFSCPFSLYTSVLPLFFWTCYIIVCLSALFKMLSVICLAAIPGCFTVPLGAYSPFFPSLTLSLN